MRLALAIVLLPALALGQQPSRNFNRNAGTRAGNVAFRFLPAGGAGAPAVATNFVPASELTGNWWELQGDGTVRTGSQALTATGSPVTTSLGVCPNGVNCTAASAQLINQSGATSQFFATGNLATPTDVSCWALVRVDGTGTNWILGKGDNSGTGRALDLYMSAGTFGFDIYSTDATFTVGTSPQYTPGAWHLLVGTYRFVADNTSVKVGYVDGVAFSSVANARGPLQAKSNTWQAGGWVPNAANRFPGAIRSAGCTEKELSSATVTAMTNSALGLPISGSGGETLTFTRASAKSCVANDGTVNILPSGRICLANGGYVSEKPATNLAIRDMEFDNASWTKGSAVIAAPTVTANSTDVLAPDGSNNAEKIAIPAVANAGEASFVSQAITPSAAAYSWGVWLRTLSGTATVYISSLETTYRGTTACAVTSTWSRCKVENTTLTAPATTFFLGVDLRAGSGQSAQIAQTVYAWGYQVELGAIATSFIPTTTAAVARSGDALKTTNTPPALSITPSFSADILTNNTGVGYWASTNIAASDDWEIYLNGGGASFGGLVASVAKGPVNSGASFSAGTAFHYSSSYDGALLRVCIGASCTTSASVFTPATAWTSWSIGTWNNQVTVYELNGTISNVCFGKTPTACP